jgi:hypothetical protein
MTTADTIRKQISNLEKELAKLTTTCKHPLNSLTIWPHQGTAYKKCLACGRSIKFEVGGKGFWDEIDKLKDGLKDE